MTHWQISVMILVASTISGPPRFFIPAYYSTNLHLTFIQCVDFVWQVDIDFEKEPIGIGKDGKNVYFRDIWPSTQEVADVSIFEFC